MLLDGVVDGGQAEETHRVALDLGVLILVYQRSSCPIEAVEYCPHHVAQIVNLSSFQPG